MENDNRHHELRAKVLFGQPWTIEEQLEVWELLAGEKIEHGRRCKTCDCSGTYEEWQPRKGFVDVPCDDCNGTGYTVRPTWMVENNVK